MFLFLSSSYITQDFLLRVVQVSLSFWKKLIPDKQAHKSKSDLEKEWLSLYPGNSYGFVFFFKFLNNKGNYFLSTSINIFVALCEAPRLPLKSRWMIQ